MMFASVLFCFVPIDFLLETSEISNGLFDTYMMAAQLQKPITLASERIVKEAAEHIKYRLSRCS